MGAQIKRRRRELGLTIKEVAQVIGVRPCTLGAWEKGQKTPPRRFRIVIDRFLD